MKRALQRLPRYVTLDIQGCGWGGLFTYFKGEDVFSYVLVTTYANVHTTKNFIGHDLSNVSKKSTTSIEVKIATKTSRQFSARVRRKFLLSIGIRSGKGIRKNFPNFEVCDPLLAPSTTLHI